MFSQVSLISVIEEGHKRSIRMPTHVCKILYMATAELLGISVWCLSIDLHERTNRECGADMPGNAARATF